MVQLLFVPTQIDNPTDPNAKLSGNFVYRRKKKNDEWEPFHSIQLSKVKPGESFSLQLHASELLRLYERLNFLYGLDQIPKKHDEYLKITDGVSRLLQLAEPDFVAFLDEHSDEATETIAKLLRWVSASGRSLPTAKRFADIAPQHLPNLNALVGIASIKDALTYWNQNLEAATEDFWQASFWERSYALSQAFAYPVVVINQKAYVGGKSIDNTGGGVVDFLAKIKSTDAVVLIDIKTPQTNLLGPEYRNGAFPLSAPVSGAISQILRYRQSLTREFHALTHGTPGLRTLGEPRCLIVVGRKSQLQSQDMRESFELQRERVQGVTLITFDELFERLELMVKLLEAGAGPENHTP